MVDHMVTSNAHLSHFFVLIISPSGLCYLQSIFLTHSYEQNGSNNRTDDSIDQNQVFFPFHDELWEISVFLKLFYLSEPVFTGKSIDIYEIEEKFELVSIV